MGHVGSLGLAIVFFHHSPNGNKEFRKMVGNPKLISQDIGPSLEWAGMDDDRREEIRK